MFYRPENGHGLPHNPMTAIVAPRPIGWISTRAADGSENLAPYSYFNLAAASPPQVMFGSTASKADQNGTSDTVANILETGVFCVNIVSRSLLDAMNATSAPLPREIDEFTHAHIERLPCETIACARVALAPAALECRKTQIIKIEGQSNFVVIGTVTGVHIAEEALKDGIFSPALFGQMARCGYQDYAELRETFPLARPQR